MVQSVSVKTVCLINVVALRWAQLVHGWVAVSGQINHISV